MTTKKTLVQFYLDKPTHEYLKQLARLDSVKQKETVTVSMLIRQAVDICIQMHQDAQLKVDKPTPEEVEKVNILYAKQLKLPVSMLERGEIELGGTD